MLQKGEYKEPKTILKIIENLVNYDQDRYHYFINWIAYFFQGLKKSQVAMVLKGEEGAGKGLFFEKVISPIFGHSQKIDNDFFSKDFLGGVLTGRLFYNIDELRESVAKKQKSFLKALITNSSMTLDQKKINITESTKIYGQVYITINEPKVLDLETHDKRYTIFTTGGNLANVDNLLGFGDYEFLEAQIEKELKDFALFLKSYKVDKKLANTALNTPEKRALINATADNFTLFTEAIVRKDLDFFIELEEIYSKYYEDLKEDFEKNRITSSLLPKIYEKLFNEHISTQSLIKEMRLRKPLKFSEKRQKKTGNIRYYPL